MRRFRVSRVGLSVPRHIGLHVGSNSLGFVNSASHCCSLRQRPSYCETFIMFTSNPAVASSQLLCHCDGVGFFECCDADMLERQLTVSGAKPFITCTALTRSY